MVAIALARDPVIKRGNKLKTWFIFCGSYYYHLKYI